MYQQIIASLEMSRSFLLAAVADIPDERFAEQPPGVPNHAAWTLGHLVYSCQLIGSEMGLQPWLGEHWNWPELFGGGSVPVATRDAYPAKPEIVSAIDDGLSRLIARLGELGDAGLNTDLPDARYRHVFPTLGHAVLQVAVAHFGYHIGQLVVWRKAVGMGPINQRFL